MSAGDVLPPTANILRVPSEKLTHAPAGESLPTPEAFALSSEERATRDRGQRVRVSVWDARKITPIVAVAQRRAGPHLVFALAVAVVDDLALRLDLPTLRVVEDPEGVLPGTPPEIAVAHAGIEGLDVGTRRTLKDIRLALADACRPVVC